MFIAPLCRREKILQVSTLEERRPGRSVGEKVFSMDSRLNMASIVFAHPLPHGRGSVTEPRASASGHAQIVMTLCLVTIWPVTLRRKALGESLGIGPDTAYRITSAIAARSQAVISVGDLPLAGRQTSSRRCWHYWRQLRYHRSRSL